MRRRIAFIVGTILAFCLFAGCASGTAVDVKTLAQQIANDVSFDEPLTELDPESAERVFRVEADEVAAVGAWVGSGATVDEVCVWDANDNDDAEDIEEVLAARVASRTEDYQDYKPDEVPKLEQAVLVRNGKYVALCVGPDAAAARSLIEAAFKG